ncbi:hypothetical protein [Cellulosimicrobium sp. CUA-896]|uniref:hypothetical protein n=1 Tax=Cellulosimicrobium sp. CUA-896 TaxID=1517881 RepID=UPI0021010E6C|nr:hypothetical protein [Cellulosimicrobium sp. CUA-896]
MRLPRRLFWSAARDEFDLADADDRAEVYAAVLAEGEPDDIEEYVDGVLLVAMWDTMWLPPPVRSAWQPVIDSVRGRAA